MALVVSTVATISLATGPAASPRASAAIEPATLVIAPDAGGVTRAGQNLRVTILITNTSSSTLPAGRLTLSVATGPSASTSALLAAIQTPPDQLQRQLAQARASVPALPAAGSRTVRLVEQHEDLDALFKTGGGGARILYVQYAAGPEVRIIQQAAIVRMTPGSKAAVGLAAVIPLLAPANSSGVVDAATQQAEVAPSGGWATALRAAQADPAAAVALDPEVLASIRLAGSAAPPDVSQFLSSLQQLSNEFLRLPYGDTDVTLERAAGVTASLDPTSFANVAVPSAASTGKPQIATPPSTTTSRAAADLTDWNWSKQSVTWPVPRSMTDGALTTFGHSSVLLSSDDIADTAVRRASGPLAHVASTNLLVTDPTVSSLVSAAAGTGTTAKAALATLSGFLATAAVNGETSAFLAAIGRGSDTPQLDAVFQVLKTQPWVRFSQISGLSGGTEKVNVALKPGTIDRTRLTAARTLVAGERDVQAVGKAAITGGATITAPRRLALLGMLSSAWRADSARWRTEAASTTAAFARVLAQVGFAKQSPPLFVGNDGKFKVYVTNKLAVPVRVTIHGAVSNGAVQFIDRTANIIVPADGATRGILPFRSIRNGRTDLTLSLTTPSGTSIGGSITSRATVRAGFDTIVAIGLLTVLAALLVLGIYRNIKRRTRQRASTSTSH